jgi:hypothetical protein
MGASPIVGFWFLKELNLNVNWTELLSERSAVFNTSARNVWRAMNLANVIPCVTASPLSLELRSAAQLRR